MACCAVGLCGRFDLEFPEPGLVHGSSLPKGVPTVLRGDRFHCEMCYVLPLRFRPPARCRGLADDGEPCRFVEHHRPPCRSKKQALPSKDEEDQANPERGGAPKLAAGRARPLSRKSKRAGPHWVPPARRV